jgi:hypothetical protein
LGVLQDKGQSMPAANLAALSAAITKLWDLLSLTSLILPPP